jgi:hypothetical protein
LIRLRYTKKQIFSLIISVTTTTKRARTTKVVPLFHNSNDYDDEEQANRISPG